MNYVIKNQNFKNVLNLYTKDFLFKFVNFLFEEKNDLYFFFMEDINQSKIQIFYQEIKNQIDLDKIENKNLEYIENFLILIFSNLINQDPKFDVIYSKILLLFYYFKICKIRKIELLNPYLDIFGFKQHLKKGISNKIYNLYYSTFLEKKNTKYLLSCFKTILIERDLLLNSNALKMFFFRYSYTNLDINFIELPQEVFFLMSLMLAKINNNINKNFNSFKEIFQLFYNQISLRKISPATPFLANLRTNYNTASCFIMSVQDSLEGILSTGKKAAQIAKNGGGVGIDCSNIRCRKSYIRGISGKASGVIPYAKVYNDLMIAFDQLGKRDGALTIALAIWHKDVLSFLDLQTEENFDYRMKAFDVFLQIIMHDLFMQYVIDDKDWLLVDPHEIKMLYKDKKGNPLNLVELYGDKFNNAYIKIIDDVYNKSNPKKITMFTKIKARKLMDIIINTQIHTGLPYIFFKDTVNNLNPNKDSGMIYCGNLCQESFSNFGIIKNKNLAHTCNLLSINLVKFVKNEKVDFIELKKSIKCAVLMLDNIIELSFIYKTSPIKNSYFHNDFYRTIGIGFMGLNDLLAGINMFYGSNKSINFVDNLFEYIGYYTLYFNSLLAKNRGSYKMFKYSEWKKGILFGKNLEWFEEHQTFLGVFKWSFLINHIKKFGLRNGQCLAIAPNSSTSLMNGVSSSVLPIYNRFFLDKNQSGSMYIYPYFFENKLEFYVPNKEIPNEKIVKLISKIYKWIDQGISMELLIDVNKKDARLNFFELMVRIWKSKIKTIYYIRTIQYSDKKHKNMMSLSDSNNDNKKDPFDCKYCAN